MAGMLNPQTPTVPVQVAEPVTPTPMNFPSFPIQQYVAGPMEGYGAARFLTGDMQFPMNFNVPLPETTYTPFMPGQFSNFLSVSNAGKRTVVFNPATGMYERMTKTPDDQAKAPDQSVVTAGQIFGTTNRE